MSLTRKKKKKMEFEPPRLSGEKRLGYTEL